MAVLSVGPLISFGFLPIPVSRQPQGSEKARGEAVGRGKAEQLYRAADWPGCGHPAGGDCALLRGMRVEQLRSFLPDGMQDRDRRTTTGDGGISPTTERPQMSETQAMKAAQLCSRIMKTTPASANRVSTLTTSWHETAEQWAAGNQAFEVEDTNIPCTDLFLNFLCVMYRFKSRDRGTRSFLMPDEERESLM